MKLKLLIILCTLNFITSVSLSAELNSDQVAGNNGMVSSQDEYATDVGINILKEGGNAVDAAIAVAYTMAVTHPRAGNIGGGGFMLFYHKKSNQVYALDFREKAPAKAFRDLFLDDNGDVDNQKARFSIFSAGVPGTVSGLESIYEKFASLPRKRLLKDAIYYASNGFELDQDQYKVLNEKKEFLTKDKQFKKIFYNQTKDGLLPKKRIVQKNLAKTLKSIEKYGSTGFYSGEVADKFIKYFEKENGLITHSDLLAYQPVWRSPIIGTYKEYDIISMPPPSSGGIALIQLLNILENKQLNTMKHNSTEYIHTVVEAMKFVYADRAKYLGDNDFVTVPVQKLISKKYASSIAKKISEKNITDVKTINPELLDTSESLETTHFSIIDAEGNVVSCTYTLNFAFGNGMIAGKTGVILNNEMDDFVAKPGTPNGFGLLGNEKNQIAPNKRMLSSMTPTIVMKNNNPFLITGSPGGSTIITSVLQVILNVLDFDMSIGEASSSARFHHQWYPDVITLESSHSPDVVNELIKKGYKKRVKPLGITQSILIDDKKLFGKSDPRNTSSSTKAF